MSPDAKEAFEFTCDNYKRTISIVKNGIEDGTFRHDADPFLGGVLIALIGSGIIYMSPTLRTNMEKHGITMQQLNLEIADIAYRMVMKTKEGDENIHARMLNSNIGKDVV